MPYSTIMRVLGYLLILWTLLAPYSQTDKMIGICIGFLLFCRADLMILVDAKNEQVQA